MADQKLTALTEDTSPSIDDYIYSVNDPAGTPTSRRSTIANFYKSVNGLTEDTAPSGINDFLLSYDTSATSAKKIRLIYLLALFATEGQLVNGVITPSVASNNLTVAIKTLAGSDPSSTDPVFVKINGTVRTIAAACSITLNAGTNWFKSGSSELATQEIDYFLYAIWDSADSLVRIAPARVPYGSTVNATEFSATTTNEKYLGGYSNYTVGDNVTVIGRFAATLSAGAGYTWTVPTYTHINLKQYPIFETRILSYLPTWNNLTLGDGTRFGKFYIQGRRVMQRAGITFGSTTSITGTLSLVPITTPNSLGVTYEYFGETAIRDFGTALYEGKVYLISGSLFPYVSNSAGTYAAITVITSTVPMTWTTSDEISMICDYSA